MSTPIVILVLILAAASVAMSAFGLVSSRRLLAEHRCRLDRYRRAVDDLDRWCGHEFPHARLIAAHLHAVGEGHGLNAGTPAGDEPCTISGLRDQLRRKSESGASGAPSDPMDWPLPCDVRVGHGVMRKGVRLGTLVARMKVLYEMATGANADEVAGLTLEQRQALHAEWRKSGGLMHGPFA